MQSYRVLAVGGPIANAVRKTLRSPGYGHPAHTSRHLTLNAYARARRLVAPRYVSNGGVETELQRLFQDRDVAYIHVRDTDAGCYGFCIERTGEEESLDESSASNGEHSHE